MSSGLGRCNFIAAKSCRRYIGEAKRLQLAPKICLAPRHELDPRRDQKYGDGGYEHDGENVGAQSRQHAPGKIAYVAKVPSRRKADGLRSLEGPAKGQRVAKARSGERESDVRKAYGDEQNGWQ